MMGVMRRAILATLEYCDKFFYPLREGELWERLVWQRAGGRGQREEKKEFKKTLELLARAGKVDYKNGFYFLKGRGRIVGRREKRQRFSQLKWEKAKSLVGFLKRVRWILGVGVTGSAAVGNADRDDDIDLMIITQERRLWLTRLVVVAYLKFKGWRRPKGIREHKGGKVRDKFCDNLYMDEVALVQEESLRTAYEIVQARPIWDRGGWERFLRANEWVKKYLPNWQMVWSEANRAVDEKGKEKKETIADYILDGLNWGVYMGQKIYMAGGRSLEKVDLHQARFYVSDLRQLPLDKDLGARLK